MIIKRIRQSAKRQRRPLAQVRAIIEALTAYSIDADLERLLVLDSGRARANYVLDATDLEELGVESGEKVDNHGTRNLTGTKLREFQQQMIAACLLTPGAKDPIEHYVASWRAGEIPNDEQIDEVVDIFAAEMGFGDCQILWATHSNTAQRHLHLVVNRVDLARERVVSPGDGWEIDRLHQVVALVEDRQGWSSEPNAIYTAKGGVVIERATAQVVRRADGSRDGCHKRSHFKPVRKLPPEFEVVVNALEAATSWRDLHYRLAGVGASYLAKGSGAEVFVGGERMPASDFGREFSFKRMVDRLGDFEPDVTQPQDPYDQYRLALRDERARVRERLNAALKHAREKRRLVLNRLRQLKRDAFLQAIDEARVEMAFDRVDAAIKKNFDVARRSIARSYLSRERWFVAGRPMPEPVVLPEVILTGGDPRDVSIAQAHGFEAQEHEIGADYCDKTGRRAVTDLGVLMLVHQTNIAAVELALELASTRSSTITVAGSPPFLDLCREVAKRRRFELVLEDGSPLEPTQSLRTAAAGEVNQGQDSARDASQALEREAAFEPALSARAQECSLAAHFEGDDASTQTAPADEQKNDDDRTAALLAAARDRQSRDGRS